MNDLGDLKKNGICRECAKLNIVIKIIYHLGQGNGNPLQYSCLENSTAKGAWQATDHGVTKESDMTK